MVIPRKWSLAVIQPLGESWSAKVLTCVPQSLYCLNQILATINLPVLIYVILLKALLIVLNGRVLLLYLDLWWCRGCLSHLPDWFKYSHCFWSPSGLQELLKINSESSDDSLNLYSKDFVLIKNFPSHDRKGKEFHVSYNVAILY